MAAELGADRFMTRFDASRVRCVMGKPREPVACTSADTSDAFLRTSLHEPRAYTRRELQEKRQDVSCVRNWGSISIRADRTPLDVGIHRWGHEDPCQNQSNKENTRCAQTRSVLSRTTYVRFPREAKVASRHESYSSLPDGGKFGPESSRRLRTSWARRTRLVIVRHASQHQVINGDGALRGGIAPPRRLARVARARLSAGGR